MSKILNTSSIRYLLKHPWQIGLSIIGITLGVAVVIAVDLANESAGRAFQLSMESVTGKATHQIVGGPGGVPDSLYHYIRVKKKIRPAAPVVEGYMQIKGRTFTLFGIDPFAEQPFRPFLAKFSEQGTRGISAFMTEPNAVLMSRNTAQEFDIHIGDTVSVVVGSDKTHIKIIGYFSGQSSRSTEALANLLVTDISTAQELLGINGQLTRIDLILSDDADKHASIKKIERFLPADISIRHSDTRSKTAAQMVAAFQINLTALSLLALVVGMFLIYNTMTFSVVQRRSYIGLMRSIGVTRREIFSLILNEALLLGIIGTIAGIFFGIILGKGLVRLVTQSINDLYFVVSVRSLDIPYISLFKGIMLGIGATFFAALKPAREATSAPARAVLSRSLLETKFVQRIPLITLASILFLILGAAVLWLPGTNIYSSYTGIVILVFGFTLLTPVTILLLVRLLTPLMGKVLGIFGRMATRDIMTQLSRINVAIAALSLAVATAVGVGTMISSFRATVVVWLENRLQADIFISAPSYVARLNDGSISNDFLPRLANISGIKEIDYYREIEINTGDDVFYVRGMDIEAHNFSGYRFKSGEPDELWPEFLENDAIIVSETFAFRRNLNVGSVIDIPTDRGVQTFKIVGIYYDYASDLGVISMNYPLFRRYFDDNSFSGISLFLENDADLKTVMSAVETQKKPDETVIVMSQRTLLDTSIEIFDRTFIITNVLQILAIVVAFIGILSAFMALQLERRREFGILRANGMTVRQIWKLVSIQTTLMGFIAGLLSLPLGNLLAWVLIYIINKRSFGWTLQFQFRPDLLVQAVILAVVAAILAGIYPAWRMANTSPVIAMREE